MKRAPADVYAALIAAGFPPAAATTMTQIAGAESGYDDSVLGDTGLQTNTWGPSFGLFQIRTLKSDTGRGTDRDISRLAGSIGEQAEAAYDISGGGKDFSPWSVFTKGLVTPALTTPADLPASTSWTDQALGGARDIAISGSFVVLGIGLLAAGAYLLVQPHIAGVAGAVRKVLPL